MNYFLKTILVGVAIVLAVVACKKETHEIGQPFSKVQGINGTWQVNGVVQIDELSPVKDEMDLTKFFVNGTVAPLEITFVATDFSYSVEDFGGKNPFGDAGNWAFDDVNYPTYVYLYNTANDTIQLKLGQTIRPTDETLLLDQQRLCDSSPIITYQFTFNRQ